MKPAWPLTAAALLLAAMPLAATAAPWARVTSPTGGNSDQVSLARTADGVLHVAWQSGTPTNDLFHTAISPTGRLGATSTIQAGWASLITNPAIVSDAAGLRVLWGGLRTLDTTEPLAEIATATSADGGTTWALQPTPVVDVGQQSYGSPTSAAVLASGSTMQTWAGTLGVWTHVGLGAPPPTVALETAGGLSYDANVAADPAGGAVVAWYSAYDAFRGVLAQPVDAAGQPSGARLTMPGTAGMTVGMLGRTPITYRPGGGHYVAYATGTTSLSSVRLWRVGAPSAPVVGRTGRLRSASATVAAAADGRLWVAWVAQTSAGPRVYARRSNPAATVFGATVDAGRPARALQGYRIDASPVPAGLDVLASFTIGVGPGSSTFHTRVLPGLTLQASRTSIRRGVATPVRFTVLDAGAPVAGVLVRAAGRTGRTDARGRVTLTLTGAARGVPATASRSGYTAASLPIRVTR